MAPWLAANGSPRVLVVSCDHSNTERLSAGDVRVVKLPCVGMLPPSFVDFALARDFADGVMIAGCAENDCFHRLGNEWTGLRLGRQRDPRLRQRVPDERLKLAWLPALAGGRRKAMLEAFRIQLSERSDG